MGAITNQMQTFEISEYSFLGKDLTIEKDFLQTLELSFQKEQFNQKIEFSIMLESVACVYLLNGNLCQITEMCLNWLS